MVCVRETVSTGTRWSWHACGACRKVNKKFGSVLGGYRTGYLPLGVHSLMNGVTTRQQDDGTTRHWAQPLIDLIFEWRNLLEWRDAEGRRLAESAGITADERPVVPLDEWLSLFPSSTGASVDAMCRYVGIPLTDHPEFEELEIARLEFLYSF